MNENTFTLDGKEFKINKIDAMKQFHIARRIAPLLARVMPVLGELASFFKKTDGADSTTPPISEAQKFEQVIKLAGPLLEGFAQLPEADAQKLLNACLSAVEMKQPEYNSWAFVMKNDTLMFANIDAPLMMKIAGRSFMYNMRGFISVLG